MGAWTSGYFGNDSALDFIIALSDTPSSGHHELMSRAASEYLKFEELRSNGMNARVRTAADADILINMCSPPLSGEMAAMVRAGVGKTYEYSGDEEAFQLIAAAALLLASRTGDLNRLPDDARCISLEQFSKDDSLARTVVDALALIPNNTSLTRDCGQKWKKLLVGLIEDLNATLTAGSNPEHVCESKTPRKRSRGKGADRSQ